MKKEYRNPNADFLQTASDDIMALSENQNNEIDGNFGDLDFGA